MTYRTNYTANNSSHTPLHTEQLSGDYFSSQRNTFLKVNEDLVLKNEEIKKLKMEVSALKKRVQELIVENNQLKAEAKFPELFNVNYKAKKQKVSVAIQVDIKLPLERIDKEFVVVDLVTKPKNEPLVTFITGKFC
jgi:regulator of replication initiation timing